MNFSEFLDSWLSILDPAQNDSDTVLLCHGQFLRLASNDLSDGCHSQV